MKEKDDVERQTHRGLNPEGNSPQKEKEGEEEELTQAHLLNDVLCGTVGLQQRCDPQVHLGYERF